MIIKYVRSPWMSHVKKLIARFGKEWTVNFWLCEPF